MSDNKSDGIKGVKAEATKSESSAQALALPLRNPGPKLTLAPTQPANTTQQDKGGGTGDKK